MAAIGIIGGGNLGANTAFFAAEKAVGDVRLYDVQEGVPIGKALDMMEAAPVRRYQHKVTGTNDLSDVIGTEVAIVAAGEKRSPGMKRSDLAGTNSAVVGPIAEALAGYAGVVIVATEPVDAMTALVVERSGISWSRVLGVGGVLDSLRLQQAIAAELGVAPEDVAATVIGPHSDEMLILSRYTSVGGVPVEMLISRKRLEEIFDEVRGAGDTILQLAGRTSAYYGPAAAATDLADAVIRDSKRIFSVSLMLSGQFGISGRALSLPVVVTVAGIARVLEPQLTPAEENALRSVG